MQLFSRASLGITMRRVPAKTSAPLLVACLVAGQAAAQINPGVIDNERRIALAGHVHPKARQEDDRGQVDPTLVLPFVTLTFSQSSSKAADLEQLLAAQQDPASPEYHRWLSPDQYAQRFGVNDTELAAITGWLKGQGLTIASVARGRNWVAVSGTAAQIENAFHTSIHKYAVDGKDHFSNSTNPSVPAALGMVKAIRGLNDFRARPALRLPHVQSPRSSAEPEFTSSRGNHYLAPDDFAKIYNAAPLLNAGINGAGQKIVVAGQTQVNLTDIRQFRSTYGLPANDPQTMLVPNSRDPGLSNSDLPEADLDLEWAGAVARNASIIYVYSYDVMQAVQYAVDQNLAPVISTSYGSCEIETSSADAQAFQSWARQGNAQGITWLGASGDNGAADCNDAKNPGLAVDLPASLPEVTGVGGTEFVEGAGTFWNMTTDANGASALTAIPETAWNDSAADSGSVASGGGASLLFMKPAWQTGPGVPADNSRHVPDVAFNASADHDGYLVYTGGSSQVYGGTSVPTPAFAGVVALLNQYLISSGSQASAGLGNINPNLYALAQKTAGIFRDVTTGNNVVTVACPKRTLSCSNTAVGFNAGAGYDQVTGLGSVDAYNFVTAWTGSGSRIPASSSASISLLSNVSNLATSDSVFLTATVSSSDGTTPAGSVSFSAGPAALGSAALIGSAGIATATLAVTGAQLPLGATTITASYVPASSNVLNASVNLTIVEAGSLGGTHPSISGIANAASYRQSFAPGTILSLFGSQLAPTVEAAGSVPLPDAIAGVAVTINGVSAPLFYVSPTQLNVQIPYEIAPNTPATITVNNNGQLSSSSLNVAAAAPGVFADQNGQIVPSANATRGQVTTCYFTGAGGIGPAVATGSSPSSTTPITALPAPTQAVTVTVGGVPANVNFIGVPHGLVGVTQVNFTVPANVAPGLQPVVITVGGVSSPQAYLNVNG